MPRWSPRVLTLRTSSNTCPTCGPGPSQMLGTLPSCPVPARCHSSQQPFWWHRHHEAQHEQCSWFPCGNYSSFADPLLFRSAISNQQSAEFQLGSYPRCLQVRSLQIWFLVLSAHLSVLGERRGPAPCQLGLLSKINHLKAASRAGGRQGELAGLSQHHQPFFLGIKQP